MRRRATATTVALVILLVAGAGCGSLFVLSAFFSGID